MVHNKVTWNKRSDFWEMFLCMDECMITEYVVPHVYVRQNQMAMSLSDEKANAVVSKKMKSKKKATR